METPADLLFDHLSQDYDELRRLVEILVNDFPYFLEQFYPFIYENNSY